MKTNLITPTYLRNPTEVRIDLDLMQIAKMVPESRSPIATFFHIGGH